MASNTAHPKLVKPFPFMLWLGLLGTYLLIPLVLFGCSGWDFGWWQAWIFSLLVIIAGVAGRFLAERRHPGLMAERVSFKRDSLIKPWDKVLSPLMSISVGFPMHIVAGLDHQFGWSPIFPI